LPRYVRITDVDEYGNLSEESRSAELSNSDVEKYRLREGDVLLARSGATVGKSYMYRPSDGFCIYAGYMIRFRPDPKRLLPEVLFRYTHTHAYWRWIESQARAVAQPNINAKMYSELPVPLPDLALQQKFVQAVQACLQHREIVARQLEQLGTLFGSLQHRAFTGQL